MKCPFRKITVECDPEYSEELFSIDSQGKTIETVAMCFADTYFDKPRKVETITDDARFTLEDGVRWYQIKFVKGDYIKTSDTYKIYPAII